MYTTEKRPTAKTHVTLKNVTVKNDKQDSDRRRNLPPPTPFPTAPEREAAGEEPGVARARRDRRQSFDASPSATPTRSRRHDPRTRSIAQAPSTPSEPVTRPVPGKSESPRRPWGQMRRITASGRRDGRRSQPRPPPPPLPEPRLGEAAVTRDPPGRRSRATADAARASGGGVGGGGKGVSERVGRDSVNSQIRSGLQSIRRFG